jgi:hypothetical protein
MLEIIRKYTYLPEVVVSSAGSSTTRAARHKWKKKGKKKKNRSRIYDLGVVPTRGNNSEASNKAITLKYILLDRGKANLDFDILQLYIYKKLTEILMCQLTKRC